MLDAQHVISFTFRTNPSPMYVRGLLKLCNSSVLQVLDVCLV